MKKVLCLFLMVLAVSFSACTKKDAVSSKPVQPDPKKTDTPKGIAFNKIKFEEVKESNAPKELAAKLGNMKTKKGFTYYLDKNDGYVYIAVFAGEKTTGGHSIKVIDIADSEGRTGVTVEEKIPGQGEIVTQNITFPLAIVRAKGITTNISVSDTKGKQYAELK